MQGFGDKQQADRELDALIRQLSVSKEAKETMPNISGLLGESSPEDYFRFKQEPRKQGLISTQYPEKYKEDLSYGPMYKQAHENLKQDPLAGFRFLDIAPGDERKLKEEYEEPSSKAINVRGEAEKLAAEAFGKDILKSTDREDFINKLKEFEGLTTKIPFAPKDVSIVDAFSPEAFTARGEYEPKNRTATFWSPSLGTAMHELGHARMIDKGTKEGKLENRRELLDKYITRKAQNDPEYNKYIFQKDLPLSDDPDTLRDAPGAWLKKIDEDERKQLINEALSTGQGATIADKLSRGHFGSDIINYPIDRTMEVYEDKLKERGFEQEQPETNPKFEKVRSLIETLRGLK